MPEVVLHRLDIVAILQRNNGEGMTQVMKTPFGHPQFDRKCFEGLIDRDMHQVAAEVVGKDQMIGVVPRVNFAP